MFRSSCCKLGSFTLLRNSQCRLILIQYLRLQFRSTLVKSFHFNFHETQACSNMCKIYTSLSIVCLYFTSKVRRHQYRGQVYRSQYAIAIHCFNYFSRYVSCKVLRIRITVRLRAAAEEILI